MPTKSFTVDLFKVEKLAYPERLTANSLQGLVNRSGAKIFLDYGIYDDPGTRTTNSVQMTDENWFVKYRPVLKRNDLDNLDYYRKIYPLKITRVRTLDDLIARHISEIRGMVVWDPNLIESVNLALMYSGLKSLLVIHPDQIKQMEKKFRFKVAEDLRGRFTNRVQLYQWAFQNLFPLCKAGQVVCMEPEWKRAEFTDYIVQNKLFAFSLSSYKKGGSGSMGQKLLLLLIGGPIDLRNFLYSTHLDGLVRRLGISLLASHDPEVRLGIRIQKAVVAKPYPTIFGWHTQRDDELAFMLLISANGMRLAPTFMANNYSFHGQLPKKAPFKQHYEDPKKVPLEKDKVYLTFTLSDGDQFTLMNTAEVGNWRRKEHGKVPFNWEVQPLLAELAPALLGYYYYNLTKNDMLIAGPSGAGYVIPPLVANLPKYLKESARLCDLADIRVTTSYNGDPPMRVVRQHSQAPGKFLGFLAGYFHLGRTPMYLAGERPFVAYAWPHANEIPYSSEKTLAGIRKLLDAPGTTPRFIACHLFAYNTTLADVYEFVKTLDPKKVKVVRADEFLLAAKQFIQQGETK
jgi:hypothetical protein